MLATVEANNQYTVDESRTFRGHVIHVKSRKEKAHQASFARPLARSPSQSQRLSSAVSLSPAWCERPPQPLLQRRTQLGANHAP